MKTKDIFETENAWDRGYDAFRDGINKHDNPYTKGTNDYADWLDGWNARARDKAS